MENRNPCPVCRTPNVRHSGAGVVTSEIHCPRCGRFLAQTLADTVNFTPAELSVELCANKKELLFCLSYLSSKGLVEEEPGNQKTKGAANAGPEYRLTPAGWLALDVPETAAEPMAAAAISMEKGASYG